MYIEISFFLFIVIFKFLSDNNFIKFIIHNFVKILKFKNTS